MNEDYDVKSSSPTIPVPRFVSRVYAYPIVNDACGQVVNAYSKVRDCNRVIHAGFDLAESGLKLVTSTATPIITKLDNQITYIDDLTCKQLDKLEEKLPLVTKPTNEISKKAKVLLNDTIAPKVEAVENVYTNVKKKVTSVQEFGKTQLHNAAGTSYGKLALSKVDYALSVTDKYIEYYLPEEEKGKAETEQQNNKGGSYNKGNKAEDPLTKAGYLTLKMRKRMFTKAMSQLQQVKVRSFEAVEKMNFTVDLISYAKTQLQNVADKATHMENDFKYKLWELETSKVNNEQQKEMNNDDEAECYSEQETSSNKIKERQLLNSLIYWSKKLNLSLQAGKAVLVENVPIPERVKQTYLKATEAAQTLYHNVLNLKSNNSQESIPVIRKSFTTIDYYLKSFFDYIDETYKRLISHKSQENETNTKQNKNSPIKKEQETNESEYNTCNSVAEENNLESADNTQEEENTVIDGDGDDDEEDSLENSVPYEDSQDMTPK